MPTVKLNKVERQRDAFLTTSGCATAVSGLPEEVIAMLFAFFSRNPKPFANTLQTMIDDGHLVLPQYDEQVTNERARKFHEKMTIGYGHKSVADHAMVHWCVEGVSAVAERDFLSSRLLAATSKSTRYVNFRDAGFVQPPEWPEKLLGEYITHCSKLLDAYERLIEPATIAVRKLIPYDDEAKKSWKKEKGWENATHKRALDMVRDLLPASIKTSFGVTISATGLREMLDKRMTGAEWQSEEISNISNDIFEVCRSVVPSLLPDNSRNVPRHHRLKTKWFDGNRVMRSHRVKIVTRPIWGMVQDTAGVSTPDLVRRWIEERGHHLPPDRSAEWAEYVFDIDMPWAIHRDLGRQRMMSQIQSELNPNLGYGADPLLANVALYNKNPELAMVATAHMQALKVADNKLREWCVSVPPAALQYACPLATMVNVRWKLNVRELVHILGLRTVPQGHPSYRLLVQMVAKAIRMTDPVMRPLVDSVTNFDEIIIGRPG